MADADLVELGGRMGLADDDGCWVAFRVRDIDRGTGLIIGEVVGGVHGDLGPGDDLACYAEEAVFATGCPEHGKSAMTRVRAHGGSELVCGACGD